ncbi:MAG: hypothetical protein WCP69_00985 [Bacteroidota bacterium]
MRTLIKKVIRLFIMPLMYGVSLIFPYSSERPNYVLMPFFSLFMVLFMVLFPIIPSVYGRTFICLILFVIAIIVVGINFAKKIELYVDRLRTERYYRIKIPSEKVDDYLYISDAIDLHRKYGKYGEYEQKDRQAKLRYIEDQDLIKEYRRFNRKWEMIAVIYILLHVLAIYLWNEY